MEKLPLVTETLTRSQVLELINMADYKSPKYDWKDYLLINKGYFTTWCGETHDGYIVSRHKNGAETEYYFMEVELEEVSVSESGHTYEPTYHMLIPISERHKVTPINRCGNAKDICNMIISRATTDKWGYHTVPMTKAEIEDARKKGSYAWYMRDYTKLVPLTYSEVDYVHTPLTEAEKQELKKAQAKREAELIEYFYHAKELPKAEDDIWYEVLSGGYGTKGYDLECKIIRILRARGCSVQINGERDSFGWVTRGLFIDGNMMCIY